MTTITEANIRLGMILAEAEARQSSISAEKLESRNLIPSTIDTAMAVQALAVGTIGKDVAGWKLGLNNGRPVAAPLLDLYDEVQDSTLTVPKPSAVGIEIEVCFVLAEDLPVLPLGESYTREKILKVIESINLGAEFVSYRLTEENRVPFPLFLADRLANHSFVLGPAINPSYVQALAVQDASLPPLMVEAEDGVLFGAIPVHPQMDPVAPLLAYANAQNDHLGGLKRGQVITTGSLCGMIRLGEATRISARWDGIGEMDIQLPG